jgi:hypothetical protein
VITSITQAAGKRRLHTTHSCCKSMSSVNPSGVLEEKPGGTTTGEEKDVE